MIKLIIFDVDGVLVDGEDAHYQALRKALNLYNYDLTELENLFLGAMSTNQKLNFLSERRGLPRHLHQSIWNIKHEILIKENFKLNSDAHHIIKTLKAQGYSIAIASNARTEYINLVLEKLNIKDCVDYVTSADNKNAKPKPNPHLYLKVITHFGVSPKETLIIEDSFVGKEAAYLSGSHVYGVENYTSLKFSNFFTYLEEKNKLKIKVPYINQNLNILIPMAGAGSRFEKAGYKKPKPLIDIDGLPMIQQVIKNLNAKCNYIFIVQKEHVEKYAIDTLLRNICENCKIIIIDGITSGAAETVLRAKEFINNSNPLLIVNSDNLIEWDSVRTLSSFENKNIDGAILTINAEGNKWSYAKVENDYVTEVAEKIQISNNATTGHYYWKHGCDFVNSAEDMIQKDIRFNNEYYVAPVYNQAIIKDKKIIISEVEKFWSVGTPEDLDYFHKNCNKDKL